MIKGGRNWVEYLTIGEAQPQIKAVRSKNKYALLRADFIGGNYLAWVVSSQDLNNLRASDLMDNAFFWLASIWARVKLCP